MAALRQLDENLWVAEHRFRVMGLPMESRMTVVRLPGHRLWLHSPIAPEPELRAALASVGQVCDLIAPNAHHHMFSDAWRDHYPSARLHAAPALLRKRRAVAFDQVLGPVAPPAWQNEIEQIFIAGAPRLSEVLFFHRKSRTLIATDFVSNVGRESMWFPRLWMYLNGVHGQLAVSLMVRLMLTNRPSVRRSLEQVLAWDFDRLIVGHGDGVECGAKAAFASAVQKIVRATG